MAPPTVPGLHAATTDDSLLGGLLGSIVDFFAVPIGLPPMRGHEHHNVLRPNAALVVVYPYRYPTSHKKEKVEDDVENKDKTLARM